ncbi:unnamed protein product, partial [Closterium sp. NIES-53]
LQNRVRLSAPLERPTFVATVQLPPPPPAISLFPSRELPPTLRLRQDLGCGVNSGGPRVDPSN